MHEYQHHFVRFKIMITWIENMKQHIQKEGLATKFHTINPNRQFCLSQKMGIFPK